MMDQTYQKTIEALNSPLMIDRLAALRDLKQALDHGEIERPQQGRDVNNHIHTHYSFSPYSPAKAVWMAYKAGLTTAGLMDHDSIGGAFEFIAAGNILNFPTTIGCEIRTRFNGTFLENRRINNPDQKTVAYIALHGIPHTKIEAVNAFLTPIRKARGLRNRRMVARLNTYLTDSGIVLDYDRDILSLSATAEGGEVTERHILYGLALALISRYPNSVNLVNEIKTGLKLELPAKIEQQLLDVTNPHRAYDLLGFLKSGLVEHFYVDADEECPPIEDVVRFADENGIILAYPYLGDVGDSVTGDKKTQTFEDDYLPQLFDLLQQVGFKAVTYMPSRNTKEQLMRLRTLCEQHQFFQISGEDINSPRQAFICLAMRDPMFDNLYDAAWALIGHEIKATEDLQQGFLSDVTRAHYPDLLSRITIYRDLALAHYQQA